jgi:hypothetical protein
MTLYDQVIDEAEQLAEQRALKPYANRDEITEAVSEVVGVKLGHDSPFAFLAEAAYNRYALLQEVA